MVFVEGGVLFALMQAGFLPFSLAGAWVVDLSPQLVYAIIEVGAKTDSGPMDMARQVLSAIMVYLGVRIVLVLVSIH